MKDDLIYPWYYDASGIIATSDFISLVADFEEFATFILGLACCTPEQLGFLPTSIIRPSSTPAAFPPANLSGSVVEMPHPKSGHAISVTLEAPLFSQYVLMGRRTFLYGGSSSPSISQTGTNRLAIKFSYQALTRRPEQDIVSLARKAGVKHIPKVHMWADLWKLSDGMRDAFYRRTDGVATYEDRQLRAIVYTEYQSVKPLFANKPDLIPVMVDQMIDCKQL